MGPHIYTTLKDFLHTLACKRLKKVKVWKDHFTPKVDVTYERFIFNKRVQKEGKASLIIQFS